MNMKKTIAAIAAGAMAVSAMASSVSAIELADKVLSYNLAANHKETQKGTVTITGSLSGVQLVDGKNLGVLVGVPSGMKVKSITVSGSYGGSVATPIPTYTRVEDDNADNYDVLVKSGCVMIPIENSTTTKDGWLDIDTVGATINVSVVVEHAESQLFQINNKIGNFSILVSGNADNCYFNGYYVDKDNSTTYSTGDTFQYFTNDDNTTTDANDNRYMPKANAGDVAKETYITKLAASAFTAKGDKIYKLPFKTGPKNNENVVYYLQNGIAYSRVVNDASTGWTDKVVTVTGKTMNNDANYQNVLPVINDAIANYGTVTFTFHTATDSIVWTPAEGADSFQKFYVPPANV